MAHASEDKPIVERLANDLEAISVDVWFDKWELRVGDSLLDKISEGVASNDYIVVFLSRHSVQSKWVRLELNAGLMRELEENRIVLLPALLEDCAVPPLLKVKKWANFIAGYENGLDELLAAIFPNSTSAIRRSKQYRTSLHLIAGLSQTDQCGSNTLNAVQLKEVYGFRGDLAQVLGEEERRLLFWSAAAFRSTNPATPWFVATTVPVWGLSTLTTVKQRARWIVDGLPGVLFQFLIPYVDWASHELGECDIDWIKRSSVLQIEEEERSPWLRLPVALQARRSFIRLLAVHDREIFDTIFLPEFDESKPNAVLVLEATGYLRPPPSWDFYKPFTEAKDDLFLAGLRALVQHRSPDAIRYLRERLAQQKALSTKTLDASFRVVGIQSYADELRNWLDSECDPEISARLLVACTNAESSDRRNAMRVLEQVTEEPARTELLPSVVRAYFRSIQELDETALAFLRDSNPIVVEAAVLGASRFTDSEKLARLLQPMFDSQYSNILATAVECAANVSNCGLWERIRPFAEHPVPLLRSAFYRALAGLPTDVWTNYIVKLAEEQDPLVRLCGGRVLASRAERSTLEKWTDSKDLPDELRTAADELLFSPCPFRPDWIVKPGYFTSELARLPVRLVSMDPDHLYLDTGLDTSRRIYIWLHEKKE